MRVMLALNVSVKYFVRSRMPVTGVYALGHSVDNEGTIRWLWLTTTIQTDMNFIVS